MNNYANNLALTCILRHHLFCKLPSCNERADQIPDVGLSSE